MIVEGVVALILLFTGIATWRAASATRESADASEMGAQGALESAEATKENTRAELLVSLSQQFWSREFGEACNALGSFAKRDNFVRRFAQWREGRDPWAEQLAPWATDYDRLNAARRRIKGYYHTVYRLHRAGHLTGSEIRDLLTSEVNTELLLTGVEPLETVVTEGYDPEEDGELYDFYYDLYDRELSRPLVENR